MSEKSVIRSFVMSRSGTFQDSGIPLPHQVRDRNDKLRSCILSEFNSYLMTTTNI